MGSTIGIEVEEPKVISKPLKVKTPEELADEKRNFEEAIKLDKTVQIIAVIIFSSAILIT